MNSNIYDKEILNILYAILPTISHKENLIKINLQAVGLLKFFIISRYSGIYTSSLALL